MKLALFLDCYGVLYVSSSQLIIEMFPGRESDISNLERAVRFGSMSNGEFIDGLVDITGMSVVDIRGVYQSQLTPNQILIDSICDSLVDMYDIYIISNTTQSNLEDMCSRGQVARLNPRMILSSELLGAMKPSLESYTLAMSRAGVQANDSVLVDDSAVNVTGAEIVGMGGVHYDSSKSVTKRLEEIYSARVARG